MPRKIGWYPLPHGFVRKPKVQFLRKKFGDDSIYVLLEIISECHLNNGLLEGNREGIIKFCSVSWGRKRNYKKLIKRFIKYCELNNWLKWVKEGLILDKSLLDIHRREQKGKS